MEALRFEHSNGDYQVIVRSEDMSYAWERFKGRIRTIETIPSQESSVPYEERYCKYASKDACHLKLYQYDTKVYAKLVKSVNFGMSNGLLCLKLANIT